MNRHTAREKALQFLFECEMNCDDFNKQREIFLSSYDNDSEENVEFFDKLVKGVLENKEHLDNIYRPYLRQWTPERLPIVDRCILRLALFEIESSTVPASIAISEAVLLANTFAEEEAFSYINGVLGSVVRARENNQNNED